MSLTENALKVLEKRYLIKDENGRLLEDVDAMFRRVAKAVALADSSYMDEDNLLEVEESFYKMISNLEFLPNSPTLMNAGRLLGQLSACFVLPVEDTMEGIFESIKNAALIHKSGGGTGFSFSRLRAKGAAVKSTGGVASGPVSFMKVFNAATEAVKQGGTRRGANMGILRVDHPDIREFITCKQENRDITNFNISVGITEIFMEAVRSNEYYDLIDPKTKKTINRENAREIFDLIVNNAWNNGEPGIIFLDRLNKDNVTPQLGEIESTNPCGEQPLLPYEACNLGSLNLSIMVKEIEGRFQVDYDRLRIVIKNSVHFLDNVIDVNKYPLPEIEKMTLGTRKIGLGVMGWADMLCKLGISYNSQEAISLGDKVMEFIQNESREASIEIAQKKGVFPFFEKSIFNGTNLQLRNATTTTIAPTGTLSIIAGVSSGIEPIFAISYVRNVMDNDELPEVNPEFRQIAIDRGFYSEDLMKRIAKKGSIQEFKEIPEDIRRVFVTSHDISPEWHVKMQAAFQRYTDNAVSKTVNLCNNATKDDVRDVFDIAFEAGCKGVTIYRDGSREMQVLNINEVKLEDKKADSPLNEKIIPRTRPEITKGFTEKVRTGCGNLYITVNYDDKGICEVFTNLGRGGGCPSQSEATSRLASIALRSGMDVKSLVEQLKGIRCTSTIKQKGLKVLSCPDAIGRVIEKVMNLSAGTDKNGESNSDFYEDEVIINNDIEINAINGSCPECGHEIEHEGGCVVCRNCGFSRCG